MQLNSRRRRDHGVGAHSPHDVILVTLDDPNHNARPTNRIADARRYQASSIATRMLMNTDSARTSHSALTHDAEKGTGTPMLMGRSGHTSVRSLARYARVSAEALARHQAEHDPARRR
jgi:hypothetical protein